MIICGTGHRPNKVGGYSDPAREILNSVAMQWLSKNKVDKVISGGALGWDQALALAAWDLGIPLTMALPFLDFDSRWPKQSRDFLAYLNKNAHEVVYVSEPGYNPYKMQVRNVWMVDHCDAVLALWNGSSGGTANCVSYAEKAGKPIINLWERFSAA